MDNSDVDGKVGLMDNSYVRDKLNDLGFAIEDDSTENLLSKLNAISSLYSVKNGDLLDGLVAYAMNSGRSKVTLDLVDDYERQVSGTCRLKTHTPNRTFASPGLNNFQTERAVLRELSIDFGKNNEQISDDDDGSLEHEFAAFDDNKQNRSRKGSITSKLNWKNINPCDIKSSWNGSAFKITEEETENIPDTVPSLKLISSNDAQLFAYGHENIFDLNDIIPDSSEIETTEEESSIQTLTGCVFPSDSRTLTFENACLYTHSKTFQLDFEKIDKIALFSGKRIIVNCLIDESGICHVQSVSDHTPLNPSPLIQSSQFSNLKVFIACGPFSIKDDSEADIYFDRMIASVIADHANVLILVGPFVAKSAKFCPQEIDTTFNSYLEKLFLFLQRSPGSRTRVLIIPNAQSDLCVMPYFPTPPYQVSSKLHKNITLLPDPAIFEIEGVQFAITASDVLLHLSRSEIYKSADVENEDRMSRLISHIFQSKSMYPLYPSDMALPFSLSNSHEKISLTERPHVLIAPSLLQPMTKVVDECIVVNPGRYIRGKVGGTYATLDIKLSRATRSAAGSIVPFSQVCLLAASI